MDVALDQRAQIYGRPLFFLGLGLIAAPILVFLWQSQKGSSDRSAIQEMDMQPNMSVSDLA